MAYTSDKSGLAQIYVCPFPEIDGGRWQVSENGGNSPLWSRDGRELFYRNGDAVMVVPVNTEPTFSFETPKILFQKRYVTASATAIVGGWTGRDSYPWDIGQGWQVFDDQGSRTCDSHRRKPAQNQHRPELDRGAEATGSSEIVARNTAREKS